MSLTDRMCFLVRHNWWLREDNVKFWLVLGRAMGLICNFWLLLPVENIAISILSKESRQLSIGVLSDRSSVMIWN